MDALKNRVGAFAEGIVTMACPVLLAVALNKANLNSDGTGPTRGSIYLAVVNLIACLCAFVLLVIANMLKHRNQGSLLDFLYGCSKFLVHVCAMLQAILAYMVVLIKMSFQQSTAPLVVSILFCVFPVCWCIQSLKRGQRQDKDAYAGFHDKLDQSLDFTASVTSFLFQMLVALALESQASIGGQGSSYGRGLTVPLIFTFVFCLFATCFMLSGAVLCPIRFGSDEQRKKKCEALCMVFHGMGLMLTMILTVVVPMLTKVCIEWAVGMVILPWISVGAVFLVCLCRTDTGVVHDDDEAKPAPLGLTKAMFTGFVAVLVPSFSSGAASVSTKAFTLIAAGVVISGLLWRLLTHLAPMRAAVVAADAACLLTQVLVMGAGISFVLVAKDALARGNMTCQTPCSSGQQAQDSVLDCLRNMSELHAKNWTSVLSSVSC